MAASLGIDEVYSELLPADKVAKVEELLRVKTGKAKLAFVGNGINDSPVLSQADIGIAMGTMGSDAAIEAADIVLMDDAPMKNSKTIRISRKCLRVVYQNIILALDDKFARLVLGAVGIANMYIRRNGEQFVRVSDRNFQYFFTLHGYATKKANSDGQNKKRSRFTEKICKTALGYSKIHICMIYYFCM